MQGLLNAQIVRDLAGDGLSEADYDVLSNLSEAKNHRQRVTELASRMLWSPSRLSHHLSRMEQRGFVTRESDEKDGRCSVIALTDAGFTAIKAAAPNHVASVRASLIDVLTEDEIKALTAISEKVVDHLNGMCGDQDDCDVP